LILWMTVASLLSIPSPFPMNPPAVLAILIRDSPTSEDLLLIYPPPLVHCLRRQSSVNSGINIFLPPPRRARKSFSNQRPDFWIPGCLVFLCSLPLRCSPSQHRLTTSSPPLNVTESTTKLAFVGDVAVKPSLFSDCARVC